MIFDQYTEKEVEDILKKIQDSSWNFKKFEKLNEGKELVSIAKARIRMKEKSSYQNLLLNEEDLRFATPDMVAEYRAERLACDILVDIGCSVGLQTFAFARHCKIVYAIEIDKRKIAYAKRNAARLKIKNIEFISGDALSEDVVRKIKRADVVFSDTERLASEKQRSLRNVRPDIVEVMQKYQHLTSDFCFEVPASIVAIDVKGELEYIDIDKKLNRLDLYRGSLEKYRVSVLSLPSGVRLAGDADFDYEDGALEKYLGVVSPAVVKAGLARQLCKELDASILSSSKIFLITASEIKRSVFVEWYGVVDTAKDTKDLKEKLARRAAGQVVLRYSVPSEEYWEERRKLEKGLAGKDTVYVFKKEQFILAKGL